MTRRVDALAQVYARSLYELAEEAGGRDKIVEVAEELDQLSELTRRDASIREFLASPLINRTRRRETLQRVLHGNVTDLVLRFLLVLNNKGRLGHLETIVEAYDQRVHEAFGRIEVDVHTPAKLSAGELEALRKRIAAALGKEPVLHAYTEPAMIGGLKLRIGDQLIDGSVAGRLRRMRRNLLSGGAAAMRERAAGIIEDSERGIEP